ncbi:MAG: hypothetical protein NC401_11460 [Ruminococcus sp.]|nr:hypothetical protein [Ruminococcus sp.]
MLDKIKSGEVKIESIDDAMAAMMKQMGVSDKDMADAVLMVGGIFKGNGEDKKDKSAWCN